VRRASHLKLPRLKLTKLLHQVTIRTIIDLIEWIGRRWTIVSVVPVKSVKSIESDGQGDEPLMQIVISVSNLRRAGERRIVYRIGLKRGCRYVADPLDDLRLVLPGMPRQPKRQQRQRRRYRLPTPQTTAPPAAIGLHGFQASLK